MSSLDDALKEASGGQQVTPVANKGTLSDALTAAAGGRVNGKVELIEMPGEETSKTTPPAMAEIAKRMSNAPADIVGGLAETFAQGVTGVAGDLAGGGAAWAGRFLPGGDWERAQRWGDAVQKQVSTVGGLLGEPETNTGKAIQSALAPVGDLMKRASQWAGGATAEATGSPMAGAIVETMPKALADYLFLRGAVNSAASKPVAEGAPTPAIAPAAARPTPLGSQVVKGQSTLDPMGVYIKQQAPASDVSAAVQAAKEGIAPPAQALADAQMTLGRHAQADQFGIRLSKGQATQDPVQLSNEQNARAANPQFANFFNQQSPQLRAGLNNIGSVAAPNVADIDHISSGQSLIDSYKAKDAALIDTIRSNYKTLEDANGGSLPLNGGDFVSSAQAALKQKMKGVFLPDEIGTVLQDIKSSGSMSMENFENLRTTLAAASRKAERAGDGNAGAAIGIVRNELENMPIPEGAAADVKALADKARSSAKSRFDTIDSDPAYKAAINDSVAPDDFINKFVVRGKRGDIASMQDNLASDPLARQTIAAGAINYLKNRAGPENGNFSAANFNKGVYELSPKFDQLFADPAVADQLTNLGDVAHYTTFQPRGSFVNNSNTFTAAAGHLAEHGANMVAGYPVASWVKGLTQGFRNRKFANESLGPNAGITQQMLYELNRQQSQGAK